MVRGAYCQHCDIKKRETPSFTRACGPVTVYLVQAKKIPNVLLKNRETPGKIGRVGNPVIDCRKGDKEQPGNYRGVYITECCR